ncbi:LysM peptidoglycan-binding domain-containing protein [Terriglobus sp.]|uniref:LysM peptidoglycan-binding domain-containing protein n=1 Tax=Terriglobus sp. TaxID=1889013 RepID=UPI003B000294
MADQAALEQKYAKVGQVLTGFSDVGSKMDGIFMNGDKLVLKCEVPSKVVVNRVWDTIKQVDPSYSDFEIQMAQTGPDEQPYTIKHGDTLSAICQRFYGNANKYPQVAQANHADANNIPVGTTIQLPVLS